LTKGGGASIFNYMVEFSEAQLSAVFHALGDNTRRRMLRLLADGEHTVGQLAEPFHMSLAAASKHIKALESAGLIRRDVQGRTHRCHLNAGPLAAADEWLAFYEQFWNTRLDRLEELLRRDSAVDAKASGAKVTHPKSGAGRPKSPTSKKRSKR
jgi:DNA-binding transcriptional ArsR family regulator